jgi:uncharacterized protein
MIIDIHGHLGRWYFPTVDVTAMMAERALAENGVDMLLVSSSYALRYDLVEGNRRLAQSIRGSDRIKGYVVLNPNYLDLSLKEMEKYADDSDFVGFKIHPEIFHHRLDTPQGMVLCEAIAESKKPLLIHTFGSSMETPLQVVKPIETYPSMKIILAHSGGYDWNLANDIASLSPNLYSEICCTCTCVQKIENLIEGFGEDRVMFGSDFSLFDEAYSLGMAKDADLTSTQRRKLMGDNAAKLFGFCTSEE